MKSVRQADRLAIQVKVEGAVLSPKSKGQTNTLGTQVGFLYYSLEAKFLLSWKTSIVALKVLN